MNKIYVSLSTAIIFLQKLKNNNLRLTWHLQRTTNSHTQFLMQYTGYYSMNMCLLVRLCTTETLRLRFLLYRLPFLFSLIKKRPLKVKYVT